MPSFSHLTNYFRRTLANYSQNCYNELMATSNYYKNRDAENLGKLRALLKLLPPFCTRYFTAISSNTSALTRLNYATDLRVFFHFLTSECAEFEHLFPVDLTITDLNRITADQIAAYIAYTEAYELDGKRHTNGEKGKARKLSSVRALLAYFFEASEINANVAQKVRQPKIHQKEIVRLERDEMETLLDDAETGDKMSPTQAAFHEKTRERDVAILTLLLGTGIRVSELVGLNVEDIDFSSNAFTVTRKGGNRVILYFSAEVAEALREYIGIRHENTAIPEDEHALFISLQNRRITVRAVQNLVKKYSTTAVPMKNISPHKLRSTYGTNLYRETKDIYIVAEVLGHKDVNTTKKHYAAISEDIRKNAADKVSLREDKPSPKKDGNS